MPVRVVRPLMATVWFVLIGTMLTLFAVLDGWDLGLGAIFLFVARNDSEREACRAAIGPTWNGNEVWLITAGAALLMAFPRVYASSFSGFYLPLMLVLWLLVVRGISLEFRHRAHNPLWGALWDGGFCFGSFLLALLLGVALGNLARGLPVQDNGLFVGSFSLVLNGYALVAGALSVVLLSLHGAAFLALRLNGLPQKRAIGLFRPLAILSAVLTVTATVAILWSRPELLAKFRDHPGFLAAPMLLLCACGLLGFGTWTRRPRPTFIGTTTAIVALLFCVAASLYPDLIHSTVGEQFSLTVSNASAGAAGLRAGFYVLSPPIIAAAIYQAAVHRAFWYPPSED